MRPVRAIALAALVPFVLAGCGDGGGGADPAETPAAEAGFPVSIDTKFGEVTIDSKPERVVALGWGDAETALALGVQPVGASDWLAFGGDGLGPWAEGGYDEDPEIIGTLEPDYEQIAALEPDLILDVKSSGDEERHEMLSGIAPTVGVPEGGDAYQTGMTGQLETIAAALGEAERGEELLTELDEGFAEAAAEHPEFQGATVTVAAYSSNGWGAYVSEGDRVGFMERLGFRQNPAIDEAEADGFSVPVAEEQLDTLDADLLVVFPIGVEAEDVTDQAVFQNIPAVQDGRAVVFGAGQKDISSSFSLTSPLSVPYALDHAVPLFAEALTG